MKFDELVRLVHELEWFDLALLVQLSGEKRTSLTNQLFRWAKGGRITPLRRGLYALAEPYRQVPLHGPALCGVLYRPSYLSCEWAMSFYGLIPEAVPVYTCVTSRVPRRFENEIGAFQYRNVKQELFFGYEPVLLAGRRVLVATPYKAVFDFLHLSTGEWTLPRVGELRLSATNSFDPDKLTALAQEHGGPRERRAAAFFSQVLFAMEQEGEEL